MQRRTIKLCQLQARLSRIGESPSAGWTALGRRRVAWPLALGPAAVLLVFGSAWTVVLPGTGMPIVYGTAAGLGAMLVLEREGRFANPVAALLLAVALSSWSAGIAFSAGA